MLDVICLVRVYLYSEEFHPFDICGKGLVICHTCCIYFQKLRTVCNIFIVNLAIADLCVTGIVNPFSLIGNHLCHNLLYSISHSA